MILAGILTLYWFVYLVYLQINSHSISISYHKFKIPETLKINTILKILQA